MTKIYVDADACPVKDETVRVATRHGIEVFIVCNGGVRPYQEPHVHLVIVDAGPDVADDWIAQRIEPGDVAVTNDVPLADRCIKAGARAVRPTGEAFTADSIGMALATRDLMADLRETGTITGGPRSFTKADRSRFLNTLETEVQGALRARSGH